MANSPNGGQSYLDDVNASEIAPGEVCDCCPAALLSEGQRQVAMFRNNDNNLRDLWVTISNDNGADFDTGDDMDPNNWMINSCPSTGPDGYMNGDTLYTVWMSAGQGASRVYMSSVYLPTGTLGATYEVASDPITSTNHNYPRVAGEGQIMGVVYQQSASGNVNCAMTISTDGGNSFSQPFYLHDETFGTQRNPDVTYANGKFHVVFEDVAAGSVIYRTVSLPGVGVEEAGELAMRTWSVDRTIHLEIDASGAQEISVVNAIGQNVANRIITGRASTIQIKHGGVYLLRIRNEDGIYVRRIVVP